MELTIDSKKLGKKVTFSRPGGGYVFADLNGKGGTLGKQICKGGSLGGSTIYYKGDNQDAFNRICKNWFKQYLKNQD